METITITLPDDRLTRLKERATRYDVSPEELPTRPDDAFQAAVNYVLKKNNELYQRLA